MSIGEGGEIINIFLFVVANIARGSNRGVGVDVIIIKMEFYAL
jgi:hypothetical protein